MRKHYPSFRGVNDSHQTYDHYSCKPEVIHLRRRPLARRYPPLIRHRPFRAPHHTISHAGLVRGGRWPRPGAISLAHRGVLFLDELPEFGTRNLETLRQPLEDRAVVISRAAGTLSFPASFMLIGAMNPCPCGYLAEPTHECTCSMGVVSRYQKRISGPLLDRITIDAGLPQTGRGELQGDWATIRRRSTLSKEQRWPMCSAVRLCEAHVPRLTRGEE